MVLAEKIAEQIAQFRQTAPDRYPLLLGRENDLQFLLDNQTYESRSYAEILQAGLSLDLDKWLVDSQLKPGRHVDFSVLNTSPIPTQPFQVA
ncbi:MAG: hypothetical protein KDC71_19895 [Acidobacteria bacterium]|nr:hypothetical protein [Acidobacteriota bacterium]